eukprot:3480772-Alexandrium_andersonii.AAC.1
MKQRPRVVCPRPEGSLPTLRRRSRRRGSWVVGQRASRVDDLAEVLRTAQVVAPDERRDAAQ